MMGILGGKESMEGRKQRIKGQEKYNRQLQAFNIDRKLDLGKENCRRIALRLNPSVSRIRG